MQHRRERGQSVILEWLRQFRVGSSKLRRSPKRRCPSFGLRGHNTQLLPFAPPLSHPYHARKGERLATSSELRATCPRPDNPAAVVSTTELRVIILFMYYVLTCPSIY